MTCSVISMPTHFPVTKTVSRGPHFESKAWARVLFNATSHLPLCNVEREPGGAFLRESLVSYSLQNLIGIHIDI